MKTFIVAEIGINHEGDIEVAKQLIDASREAGADAVKFQVFWCFPHLPRFAKGQWMHLFAYCSTKKMPWFATPFDRDAVEFLNSQRMGTWKIPSNPHVVNNALMLEAISKAEHRKVSIISTGVSDEKEIEWVLQFLGDRSYILLHCVSEYPTSEKNLNLSRIQILQKRFGCPVGFSDHSLSVTAPLEAVKLGACVIEKHITLDRNMDGPDHKASLLPGEFKQMVDNIRGWEDSQVLRFDSGYTFEYF